MNEVDRVEWVDAAQTYDTLTYEDDRQIVDAALRSFTDGRMPVPVIVLRHAHAKNRNKWPGLDELRPLATRGHQEAVRLAAILAAYRPERVVSSDSLRCRQTVQPFAAAADLAIDEDHRLSEDTAPRAIRRAVQEAVESAVGSGRAVVVCSHRPTMTERVRRTRDTRRESHSRVVRRRPSRPRPECPRRRASRAVSAR